MSYVTKDGEAIGCDLTDPGQLEAWYGNFGFFEIFRHVVLAECREAQRAKAALTGERTTEARLDDLARTSETYVDFLVEHLKGRHLREVNLLKSV